MYIVTHDPAQTTYGHGIMTLTNNAAMLLYDLMSCIGHSMYAIQINVAVALANIAIYISYELAQLAPTGKVVVESMQGDTGHDNSVHFPTALPCESETGLQT